VAAVEGFWAARLGCRVEDLRRPGVVVVAHPGAAVFALLRAGTLVVAVPPDRRPAAAAALAALDPAAAFRPDRLRSLLGAQRGEVIGPAYQGFTGDVPVAAAGVRPLAGSGADRAALDALRLAAGETAWEHSAIDPDRPPLFGRFVGGVLVAAATLEDAGGPVASVGVLTHPAHRGRGHGRAVAAAATRAALAAGSLAHWQTLDANTPSVAIARALGYRRDATTLAVRPAGA
jgi:GNAT superfamily N-acetyltransferase